MVVQALKEAWQRERESNKKVEESERNLRQFLDALPVGVLVIAPDHKIYYVNHETIKIYGLEKQEKKT